MRSARPLLATLGLLVCAPIMASGQSVESFCFTARPLPECRTFLVSEVGLGRRVAGTEPPDQQEIDQMMEWRFVMELGLMVNRDEATALGGSVVIRVGDETIIWGPRARYRRWLADGRAWEIAAAALLTSGDVAWADEPASVRWASYDGLGGELGAALVLARWLAVGADVTALPFAGGGWDVSLQPSVRITGPLGLSLALAFAAVASTKPSMSW